MAEGRAQKTSAKYNRCFAIFAACSAILTVSKIQQGPMADISPAEWASRTDAALAWLRRSIAVHGGRGSAHSYSPLFGWAKAYPETTGYLIPTLLDYAQLKKDEALRQDALSCAQWLCSIQLSSGAFPGLLVGNTQPSVFNTAQILFGLTRMAEETGEEMYFRAIQRATDWLMSILETDGSWRQAAYVPGFVPSYYTRAVWGVLRANQVLKNAEVETAMRRALHFYAGRFLPNHAVRDWGFWPGKPAFTHTIAYTIEGFLESALLLQEAEILEKTISAAEQFWLRVQEKGRTAGRYDEAWRGDYGFRCLTGNAQWSIIFQRIFALNQDELYRSAAQFLLAEITDYQVFGRNKNTHGALPGSSPMRGPYLRLRYPNWGGKFYLDALFYEMMK